MHLAKLNFFEVRSFVIRKISRQAAAIVALVLSSCLVSTMECRAVTTFRTLYTFTSGNDGGRPYVGMIFDRAGNLYGTAYQGGTSNVGVVFELAPNGHGGWSESVLHSFSGEDGSMPDGVLVFDTLGNLYGTTLLGGAYGDGTVFELSPNGDGTWTESILHSFNGADGFAPEAGVILDQAGDLYGTASGGGTHNGELPSSSLMVLGLRRCFIRSTKTAQTDISFRQRWSWINMAICTGPQSGEAT